MFLSHAKIENSHVKSAKNCRLYYMLRVGVMTS